MLIFPHDCVQMSLSCLISASWNTGFSPLTVGNRCCCRTRVCTGHVHWSVFNWIFDGDPLLVSRAFSLWNSPLWSSALWTPAALVFLDFQRHVLNSGRPPCSAWVSCSFLEVWKLLPGSIWGDQRACLICFFSLGVAVLCHLIPSVLCPLSHMFGPFFFVLSCFRQVNESGPH